MNDICLEIYTGKRDLGWDKNASFFLFPCFLTLAKNTVRFVSCNTGTQILSVISNIFSSLEVKAEMSYSDHILSLGVGWDHIGDQVVQRKTY